VSLELTSVLYDRYRGGEHNGQKYYVDAVGTTTYDTSIKYRYNTLRMYINSLLRDV